MKRGKLAPPPASGPAPPPETNWHAREARWRQQMRNGPEAAAVIMTAPTMDDAVRVHADFVKTDDRHRPSLAHFALLYRTEMEVGGTEMLDVANLIVEETNDEVFVDMETDDDAKKLIALYEGNAK